MDFTQKKLHCKSNTENHSQSESLFIHIVHGGREKNLRTSKLKLNFYLLESIP